MIAFGIIAIIFGYAKRNACLDSESVPKMFIVFGIMDIIICEIIIIIVCFSVEEDDYLYIFFYRLLRVSHAVTIEVVLCVSLYSLE
jgi:hypothetical protein